MFTLTKAQGSASATSEHSRFTGVVVPLHGDDLGAVDLGREDLGALEVVGHEHVTGHAGLGCVRRGGVGEVAGRGAADRLEPERARHRDRDAYHPVLEGVRWIDGVVLDPQALPSPSRAARLSACRSGVNPAPRSIRSRVGSARQQRLVAPHTTRAPPPPRRGTTAPLIPTRDRMRARGGRSTPRRSSGARRGSAHDRCGIRGRPGARRSRASPRGRPRSAEPTVRAYFASAPCVYFGAGSTHDVRRRSSSASSTSTSSVRPSVSIRDPVPSRRARSGRRRTPRARCARR